MNSMSTDALLTDEEREIREEVRQFAASIPRQLLIDMDADQIRYPSCFLRLAGERGLLGLRFDPRWGGRGLPWSAELVALEEVGVLGTALACLYSLVSIVGEAIHVFGTDEQRARFLKPMIAGRLPVAEALTEPRGGSDFFGTNMSAHRGGDQYFLRGQKRFIVGAEGADLFLVYAKVDGISDPKQAMTAFLVERSPEMTVEHIYGLMGTRGGGTGRLVFDDVPVPVEMVLGGEAGIGRGSEVFHQMMIPERMTSAGGAVGIARAALEIAAKYSDRRKAFGKKIRRFEGVNFKVAESITLIDAARALNHAAGAAIDRGVGAGKVRRLVSEAKRFSTESAWTVVNHGMQILGGIGYTDVFPMERLLRDVRLITIWTGTNEIMNLVIQHEFYEDFLSAQLPGRRVEADAVHGDLEGEKYPLE
jgi:alkylation response protein AidB-like acyl-CoA dehydrogenase